ncbi:hypothetical protein OPT61_g853 [Boeremia exigua]|uniref:Uncharacterized protein n=1 Tax=Boeremia exigua TaxID=749465 RepID=A0ACC2IS99_9PLEO|nr:hypothetical protein OPT61_g853 [Boeremia exigua]
MKKLKSSLKTSYEKILASSERRVGRFTASFKYGLPSNKSKLEEPELFEQIWDPTCKETHLLAGCFLNYSHLAEVPTSLPSAERKALIDRVETLLKAGANPNITICTYQVNERIVHGILGQEYTRDFLEDTYENICGTAMDSDEHTNAATPLQPQLKSMFAPFLEIIASSDVEMAAIFLRYGVSAHGLLSSFNVNLLQFDFPETCAFIGRRFDLVRKIDILTDKFTRQWAICHLAETLLLCNDWYTGLPHKGQRLFNRSLVSNYGKKKREYSAVPQQALQSVKDEPHLLLTLLHAVSLAHAAVALDDTELLSAVVEAGYSVDAIDGQSLTALHIAVSNITPRMCNDLIQRGVDVNAKDIFGVTPLLEAVYFGHAAAVKLLLDGGADLYPDFEVPADHTSDRRNFLVGEWRGVRNMTFPRFLRARWSMLHIAVWRGSWMVVQLLIDRGFDLATEDASGRTVLDLSVELMRFRMTAKLLEMGTPFKCKSLSASLLLEHAIAEQEQGVADQLLVRGVERLPANAEGNDREYDEGWLPQNSFGSETDSSDFQAWELDRRVPEACCSHIKAAPRTQINQPCPSHTTTTTIRCCNLCLLVDSHKEAGYIPAGAMMQLALRHVRDTQEWQLVSTISKTRLQHTVAYVAVPWHKLLDKISYLEDRSTGSPAAIAVAEHWTLHCINSHNTCRTKKNKYSPTRLVEVLDNQLVRVVEGVPSHESYVALSHRWGQDETSKTVSTNFVQRQSAFPADQLSPTLRDAITAVQSLGYRYLWVDVLCIVQDSDEDWLHEASEMCHVYSNAAVTIAAECAEDEHTSEGMFRDRSMQESRPFHFRELEKFAGEKLEHLIKTADRTDEELYIFPATEDRQHGNRLKGMLDTRGWILQEQLLSPRILYYGRQQLYWDCISQSASELSPLGASLLDDPHHSETWALRFLRRTVAGNGESNTLARLLADVWIHVVQNYSARVLTKSSDKLIALQGVISAVESALGMSSIAGMWQHDLWKQLIWWNSDPAAAQNPTDTAFSAPTWSWLSANGAVLHHQSMRIDRNPIPRRLNDLAPVATLKCGMTGQETSATSVSGELTLSAPSFYYHLTSNDLREITWKRGHPAKLNLAPARWMLDRDIELPKDIHCAVIAEDEVAKMTVGICLVPDDTQPDHWNRIGLCLWDGLTWQIAKHVGLELEEERFVVI